MREHSVDEASLEPDTEGWYTARCECGWSMGPLPSHIEVMDALMEHGADA